MRVTMLELRAESGCERGCGRSSSTHIALAGGGWGFRDAQDKPIASTKDAPPILHDARTLTWESTDRCTDRDYQ